MPTRSINFQNNRELRLAEGCYESTILDSGLTTSSFRDECHLFDRLVDIFNEKQQLHIHANSRCNIKAKHKVTIEDNCNYFGDYTSRFTWTINDIYCINSNDSNIDHNFIHQFSLNYQVAK